jgi:hypothetical protein
MSGDPSSITSTSTPSATSMTTIVTVPPSAPDAVCWMAFVTSSEVSKVAASESTVRPLPVAAMVRVTNARAAETSAGCPGIVSEPRTAGRRLGSRAATGPGVGRVLRGVSICACLPLSRIRHFRIGFTAHKLAQNQ